MLIPLLNKALGTQGPPPPPPQFVTVGQVPLLRNHIMAAVGPMRRQSKKPNKFRRF
jgi:hypothetical protein